MPALDTLFTTVEKYDKINIQYLSVRSYSFCLLDVPDPLFFRSKSLPKADNRHLNPQFSKIGKVMRHIAVLAEDKVPRDEEFKFRDRAKALVDKWHQILNANKPNGTESGGANGMAKSDGGDKEEGVTAGTAALDLNGKPDDGTFTYLLFRLIY